jgi:hypothetical protein
MMDCGYCVLNSKEQLIMFVDGILSTVWLLIIDVMRKLCTYTLNNVYQDGSFYQCISVPRFIILGPAPADSLESLTSLMLELKTLT